MKDFDAGKMSDTELAATAAGIGRSLTESQAKALAAEMNRRTRTAATKGRWLYRDRDGLPGGAKAIYPFGSSGDSAARSPQPPASEARAPSR